MKAKQFKPEMISEEMKKACKTFLLAKAFTLTIRPIVKGYQEAILKKYQFESIKDVEGNTRTILDPSLVYLLPDREFEIYFKECKQERDKAKLYVDNDDFCPLLVAENLERKAGREFLRTMKPITRIEPEDVYDLDKYEKMKELCLKLVISVSPELSAENVLGGLRK